MKVFNILLTDKQGVIHDTLIESSNLESAINQSLLANPNCSYKSHKTATPKELFDYHIKKSFEDGGACLMPGIYLANVNRTPREPIYDRTPRGPIYDRYIKMCLEMTRKLIDNKIVESMGREISTGKFYSVASSSRLTVSSFCTQQNGIIKKTDNIGGVTISNLEFEVGLQIPGVSEPQMDATFNASSDYYCIEVKCHEIFDTSNHSTVELSTAYLGVMKELLGIDANANKWETKGGKIIGKDSKPLSPEDFGLPESKHHFDFKQFLCHLMGILSSEQYKNGQHINFFYLFYKADYCPEVYEELEAEMENIANRFSKILGDKITFGCIYNTKFDTLASITPYRIFNEQK
jgi:hypothetical protein